MKKIMRSRVFLSVIFFLFGCVLTSVVNYFTLRANTSSHRETAHWLNLPKIFSQMNPLHPSDHPRDTMENLFQEMQKNIQAFEDFDQMGSPGFYKIENFGGVGKISQREDDRFIYLDIDLKGQKPKEFKVDVKNGQVTVSGLIEHDETESSFSGSVTSSFHRSFPAPENARVTGYKLEEGQDKITIRFDKINS